MSPARVSFTLTGSVVVRLSGPTTGDRSSDDPCERAPGSDPEWLCDHLTVRVFQRRTHLAVEKREARQKLLRSKRVDARLRKPKVRLVKLGSATPMGLHDSLSTLSTLLGAGLETVTSDVDTDPEDDLWEVGEASDLGQTEEEVQILCGGEGVAVPADRFHGSAAEQRGAVAQTAPPSCQVEAVDRLVPNDRLRGSQLVVVVVDEQDATTHRHYLRMEPKVGELAIQTVRGRQIVAVHPGDEGAARGIQSLVEGRDNPCAPVEPENSNAWVSARCSGQEIRSCIVRCVVDRQHLVARHRLTVQALERRLQKAGAVVNRHQDRDLRWLIAHEDVHSRAPNPGGDVERCGVGLYAIRARYPPL